MIEIQSLSAARQEDHLLLTGLTLVAKAGDMIRIAGVNGVGKTALLRTIAGLLPPYSGDIHLENGVSLRRNPEEYRNEILYISHYPQIDESLTPRENLRDLALLQGVTHKSGIASAQAVLDFFLPDALHDEETRILSHGQKKRVQLACRLAFPKRVILLDEAFSGLDQEFILKFCNFLTGLRINSVIFYIEHQEIPALAPVKTIRVEDYAC